MTENSALQEAVEWIIAALADRKEIRDSRYLSDVLVAAKRAETAEKRIAELEAVLKSVDDLWEAEVGLRKELIACEQLKWDSPVLVIHRKIRELLNGSLRIVKEGE